MNEKLTKKGQPRKNASGRPRLWDVPTTELRRHVPNSDYERISTIVDYELEKLKNKL